MIVLRDKTIETNSLFPSTDWYNEGNYIIDETKEENKELIEKIKLNAPYMELVIEDGQIVDVIPTERPEPIPEIVNEQVDEEKAFLSEAVIQLSNELESLKQEIKTLKGGN
ncbi:hypothetical protein [Alkaliphilus sp. B6464]|uniref:hypothetical protein n=1 Tax=Alkaliphilus sp. B6464 TaxID=2731219 RepID=UPI001BA76239|nr:hypothetical protein [Alkaliphilus sp. B6464]QUH21409.1 hypothetical protein HYG84_16975 [Alkaliphilus sp. B6464]